MIKASRIHVTRRVEPNRSAADGRQRSIQANGNQASTTPAASMPKPNRELQARQRSTIANNLPSRQAPAAPPVYRPQPLPRVRQTKNATARQSINQVKHTPRAPPVYRPQPAARVLQSKTANVLQMVTDRSQGRSVGQSSVKALPGKFVQPGSASVAIARRPPQPPPVYRPACKKFVQPKLVANGPRSKAKTNVLKCQQLKKTQIPGHQSQRAPGNAEKGRLTRIGTSEPGKIRPATIQPWFKIRKEYRVRTEVPDSYVLGKIRAHGLPGGTTEIEVLNKIKDWADAADDKGQFSWDALIAKIIDDEFSVKDMEVGEIFAPYSPGADVTPPNSPVWKFERRFSGDFSDMFEKEYGASTSDVRSEKTVLEHIDTSARGTTYGAGRFMTMTGPKVLGETRYEDFLPKLPGLTGLDGVGVARAIIQGLLDDAAFIVTLSSIKTEHGAEALTKTVRLMHNEIIHRSSTNLISIIGGAVRTVTDSSKTLGARYQAEARFPPQAKDYPSAIGGQQFSRLHHEGNQEEMLKRTEVELDAIWRLNKKALASVLNAHYADYDELLKDLSAKLTEKYIANLKGSWKFEVL